MDLSYGPMTYGLGMTHTSCLKVVGAGGWWAHKILVIPSQNLDFPTLDFTFETYDLDLDF